MTFLFEGSMLTLVATVIIEVYSIPSPIVCLGFDDLMFMIFDIKTNLLNFNLLNGI